MPAVKTNQIPILSTLQERAWLWLFGGPWEFVIDNDTHWQSRGQWQFGKKSSLPFPNWLLFVAHSLNEVGSHELTVASMSLFLTTTGGIWTGAFFIKSERVMWYDWSRSVVSITIRKQIGGWWRQQKLYFPPGLRMSRKISFSFLSWYLSI